MFTTETKNFIQDKIINSQLVDHYIKEMQQINNIFLQKYGNKPRAFVVTHGCQMNARDSETISGMLLLMGYDLTEDEDSANMVIFNTCCVRENAENKLYGNLGSFKAKKSKDKNFKIVICGCMMQQDIVVDKIKESYNYVDLIFGTHNIYRFPELLYSHYDTDSMIIDIWKDAGEIVEDLPSLREFPHKSGVNIMYGCDNYCTFCIVPYVRGKERSRKPEDIIAEITQLAADGVTEVMLLGQNVDSYGKGLDCDVNFAKLLHMVAKVDGIERIRFMSSHPKDISDEVIDALKNLDKVCKHLHLPVQSGSTHTLKWMNRGYTKESYLSLTQRVRAAVPNISLTTDIIVGFPGETEEDFLQTMQLIKEVRYSGVFTFIYSIRHGTPAAKMPNQIDEAIIKERFNRLLPAINEILYEINQEKLGQILEVIPESIGKYGVLTGRANDNSLVHFPGDKSFLSKTINVKIKEARTFYLSGEMV